MAGYPMKPIRLEDEMDSDDEESANTAESLTGSDEMHPLGENIYALLIAEVTESFTRFFTVKSGPAWITVVRVIYSLMLMFGVIGLQVFLLKSVSSKLCTPSMRNIREIYSGFQKAVYGDNTYTTVNGFLRGVEGAVPSMEGFQALSMGDKVNICSVPLSQPYFTFTILLIWTITCLAELRGAIRLCYTTITECHTVGDLKDCFEDKDGQKSIVGLTPCLKTFLFVFCFFPRMSATVLLNFLGCRWLLSTASLQDLFLNSLALEFMVVLPELLYRTFATERGRKLTEHIMIKVDCGAWRQVQAKGGGLIIAFSWIVFAVVWVAVYMKYLQQVLPGYNWDVRPICDHFPEIFEQSG